MKITMKITMKIDDADVVLGVIVAVSDYLSES